MHTQQADIKRSPASVIRSAWNATSQSTALRGAPALTGSRFSCVSWAYHPVKDEGRDRTQAAMDKYQQDRRNWLTCLLLQYHRKPVREVHALHYRLEVPMCGDVAQVM